MANKKITELPLISALSGSSNGGTVIPVVVAGTTSQISAENFSTFMNRYAAQTGSANTFTANQTINANLSVTGTTAIGGNTTIGGTLVVAGRLTAEEFHTEITTASVIYSSGSTKFGDDLLDKHEFTGSVNVNGSVIVNGVTLPVIDANVINKILQTTSSLHVTTQSLNVQTGSQDLVNLRISSTTGSINTTTSSFDSVFLRISSTTGSINTTTSSFDSVFLRISSVTGSINTTTSSFDSVFLRISSTTGSINTTTSSFDLVFRGISSVTGAMNTQSSSQDLVNLGISTATGSLIGITNGLMAFTAALDNTYATDAQLYQLYQATSSIHFTTQSLNSTTGSLNTYTGSNETWKNGVRGEIDGIEAYTASLKSSAIVSSSTQIQNYNVFALTSSANVFWGNQSISGALHVRDGITGSLKGNVDGVATSATNLNIGNASTNANYALLFTTAGVNGYLTAYTDAFGGVLYNPSINKLSVTGSLTVSSSLIADGGVTGSILATNGVISSSTQIQNYDVFALNSNLYTSTGSLIGITNGLMAYTASNESWKTGVRGEIDGIEAYTSSLKSVITIAGSDVTFAGKITAQEIHTTLTTSSILYQSGSTKFGDDVLDKHEFTGSLNITGSSHTIQNGFVVLQQVSQSLNFVDDAAAAAGGIPLGGLYRNGNFIVIRLT